MADPELRLTYPCYMLQTKGNPDLIEVDGNICVLLFTDQKTVQAFCHHRDGGDRRQNIEVFTFKSQAELIERLRDWQPHFEKQGCGFIAFDVVPGQPIMYGSWTEVIGELEGRLNN